MGIRTIGGWKYTHITYHASPLTPIYSEMRSSPMLNSGIPTVQSQPKPQTQNMHTNKIQTLINECSMCQTLYSISSVGAAFSEGLRGDQQHHKWNPTLCHQLFVHLTFVEFLSSWFLEGVHWSWNWLSVMSVLSSSITLRWTRVVWNVASHKLYS